MVMTARIALGWVDPTDLVSDEDEAEGEAEDESKGEAGE